MNRRMKERATVNVVGGVSGAGKSVVGRARATALDCPFHGGDDDHPAAHIRRMDGGTPLDDAAIRQILVTGRRVPA